MLYRPHLQLYILRVGVRSCSKSTAPLKRRQIIYNIKKLNWKIDNYFLSIFKRIVYIRNSIEYIKLYFKTIQYGYLYLFNILLVAVKEKFNVFKKIKQLQEMHYIRIIKSDGGNILCMQF